MPMMTKGCWIVVADGETAMILENVGTVAAPDLRLIERMEAPDTQAPDDRPGRMSDGGPNQRSSMEVTDRTRLAQTALAVRLVGRLSRGAARGAFSRLAIAAPPQMLGRIRDRLDPDLMRRLMLALPKTLTKHPLGRIAQVMGKQLDVAA